MNNRPFFSTNTNVYDQSMFSAAPTNLNGQNVLVSQEQQRKIFDTLNTSIVGLQFGGTPTSNQFFIPFLQAQKQIVPGGVVFCFNPQPMLNPQNFMMQQVSSPYPAQNNFYPMSLDQQMATSGLQKHGLETLQYQQQLANNPFQLKFHHNCSTSCSDLVYRPTQASASRATPDFSNTCGAVYPTNQEQRNINPSGSNDDWLANPNFNPPRIDSSRNTRRLNLQQLPERTRSHVADAITDTHVADTVTNESNAVHPTESVNKDESDKKKVNFAEETKSEIKKEDKSSQLSCRCKCDGKTSLSKSDQKRKSKPKPKKSKKKKEEEEEKENDNESMSESSREDELSCCNEQKSRKKSQDKSDSQYSSTDLSE